MNIMHEKHLNGTFCKVFQVPSKFIIDNNWTFPKQLLDAPHWISFILTIPTANAQPINSAHGLLRHLDPDTDTRMFGPLICMTACGLDVPDRTMYHSFLFAHWRRIWSLDWPYIDHEWMALMVPPWRDYEPLIDTQ